MKENSLFCNEFIYQDFMVFWLWFSSPLKRVY